MQLRVHVRLRTYLFTGGDDASLVDDERLHLDLDAVGLDGAAGVHVHAVADQCQTVLVVRFDNQLTAALHLDAGERHRVGVLTLLLPVA